MSVEPKIDVIYEDNHLLVLNKPALLPTMGVKDDQASLLKLAKQYLKQKYAKPGNVYLGVVSRLDSFVSGTIVFARTSKSAARLNKQFANSTAQKRYLALVPSQSICSSGEMEHWLAKDEMNHRMMTVTKDHPSGKNARLKYHTKGQFENLALIEIDLLTGRKHQIRAQLAAAGAPIVGDRKYGSKLVFSRGIALHSHRLTIEHPTKKESMTFSCSPAKTWNLNRFIKTK